MSKPRVLIAAPGSGVGKTTVCCGILRGLTLLGYNVAAFKSGPDYIDPMFHTKVLGIPSRNLDLFMLGESVTRFLLQRQLEKADIGIIEGAMGFYDGINNTSEASAYQLSEVTNTPVVLVISCKGMARSVVALVKGYIELESNKIQGVILNGIKPGMYSFYKGVIEAELPVHVLGYLPHMEDCEIGSRHLGLATPDTIKSLQEILDRIAKEALATIDFDGLIALAKTAETLPKENIVIDQVVDKVRIGIAKDQAFCFYYEDSLQLLEAMGAELVPFSPLYDEKLPDNLHGLWIGGGYPELYGSQLEGNEALRNEIQQMLEARIPCIVECGGFMYLQDKLIDHEGNTYEMIGYVDGQSTMTRKLQPFGYITLEATKDSLLMEVGKTMRAHEFHYSESTNQGESFVATKPLSKRKWQAGVTTDTLYAGYPHLHLWSNIDVAKKYLKACEAFKNKEK